MVRANGGFRPDPVPGPGTGSGSGATGRPPTVEQAPAAPARPPRPPPAAAPTRPGHAATGHPGMMPMGGGGAGATGETRRRAPYLLDDRGIFDVEYLLHFNPPVILPPDQPDHS